MLKLEPDSDEAGGVVMREVAVTLTDADVLERADALARAEARANTLKDQRRRLNAEIRAEVDRVSDLAEVIGERSELRSVECSWQPDYRTRIWRLARVDTGEQLDTRPMTEDELQTTLLDTGVDEADAPPAKRKRKRATNASKASTAN